MKQPSRAIQAAKQPDLISTGLRAFADAAKSPNTRRAYRFAWADFTDWCSRFHRTPLPASVATIAQYIRVIAEVDKVSTIQIKLTAISFAHQAAHQPDPTKTFEIDTVMKGVRRTLGTAPDQKAPITRDDLVKMLAALPDTLAGRRDLALLLVGFAGAFRRSELVALDVSHVVFLSDRAVITVARSKTDQEGHGIKKQLPLIGGDLCPVTALRDWLSAAQIKSGPLFRKVDRWGCVGNKRLNSGTVAQIVKSAARRAGLNPEIVSGHSLRSGFITSAAGLDIAEWKIQQVSTHKSTRVLRGYIRNAGQGGLEAVRAVLGDE